MACTAPVATPRSASCSSARNLARISPAARDVNVTASTWPGATWPAATRYAMRRVMVRVLPGARTRQHAHRTTRAHDRLALLVVEIADEGAQAQPSLPRGASRDMASILAVPGDNPLLRKGRVRWTAATGRSARSDMLNRL